MDAPIRLVKLEDLLGILALYRELRPNDPRLLEADAQALLSNIVANPCISLIVCECKGILASTCMLAIVPNLASAGSPFGVIEHVVTLAQYRRQGLGRRVLQFALDRAWTQGCCKVMLLSGAGRTDAHKLYESVGFKGDVERGFVAKPKNAV